VKLSWLVDDDDNLVGENINIKKKNTEASLVSRKVDDLQVTEKIKTCSCLINRMQEKITTQRQPIL